MFFLTPFDNSSRISNYYNAYIWWRKIVERKPLHKIYDRSNGRFMCAELEADLIYATRVNSHDIPFIIGGDHSITFYSLRALYNVYGKLNVVHFDAHHDEYEYPYLNHYTSFYWSRKYINKIYPIGHRFEVDKTVPVELSNELTEGPIYITVDVDYFSPTLVPSVQHPVACSVSNLCTFDTFSNSLKKIKGPIVGIDMVEWQGGDNEEECQFIKRVFNELVRVQSRVARFDYD